MKELNLVHTCSDISVVCGLFFARDYSQFGDIFNLNVTQFKIISPELQVESIATQDNDENMNTSRVRL